MRRRLTFPELPKLRLTPGPDRHSDEFRKELDAASICDATSSVLETTRSNANEARRTHGGRSSTLGLGL